MQLPSVMCCVLSTTPVSSFNNTRELCQQHQWALSTTPVGSFNNTRELCQQHPWALSTTPVSSVNNTRELFQHQWALSTTPVSSFNNTRELFQQHPWALSTTPVSCFNNTCELFQQYLWGIKFVGIVIWCHRHVGTLNTFQETRLCFSGVGLRPVTGVDTRLVTVCLTETEIAVNVTESTHTEYM